MLCHGEPRGPGPHTQGSEWKSNQGERQAVVAVKDQSKPNPYKSAYTITEKLLLGIVLLINKINEINIIILMQDNHKMLKVKCFVDGPRIPNPMPVEYLGRIGNR